MDNSASNGVGGLSAEIITTGTEILLGEIVDTNAAWIAQQLRDIGVNLYYKSTVGDNFGRIVAVIEQAATRSDVVIVSGGLGPTADDVTRHAIAAATGCELQAHPQALQALKDRFARLGSQMTENNLQQALIPTGAILIENPVGTAPGFIVETERSAVIALPGVPREMKHLMTETVLPYLRARSGNTGVIARRVLRTIGIGESMIDSRLAELMLGSNPTVGLAAHTAQADVRITARGSDAQTADAMLDELEAEIRRRIGDHIYSTTPGETIEEAVAKLLTRSQATIALVETNTGGALAARFMAVAGGSCVARAWQGSQLHDMPDSLRAAVARAGEGGEDALAPVLEAAQVAADTCGAALGLAVVGSTGAEGGVFGSSQGYTAIGIYRQTGESRTLLLPYGGGDEYSVIRIGNQTLNLLWNLLR